MTDAWAERVTGVATGTKWRRRDGMTMYEDVLVATDGSDGVEAAVREAVDLADLSGARLHALYVVDDRHYNALPDSAWFTLEEAMEGEGEAAVAAVRERAEAAGVPVSTAVIRGVPHEEILAYADDPGVDAVVMGTHGRSGLDHVLLGSVTEKVIRRADVPVLVVRIED